MISPGKLAGTYDPSPGSLDLREIAEALIGSKSVLISVRLALARRDAKEQYLFLGSMQLASTRQGDKERELRDDVQC